MNVFLIDFDARLQAWHHLKKKLIDSNITQTCIEVDAWWQQAPLINHHLHPADIENWPTPWELLAENTYCTISRGLGICYTLLLLGIQNIDFSIGKDDNNEEVALVLVDHAKYILNYYPNTVLSNTLHDFKINNSLELTKLLEKIK